MLPPKKTPEEIQRMTLPELREHYGWFVEVFRQGGWSEEKIDEFLKWAGQNGVQVSNLDAESENPGFAIMPVGGPGEPLCLPEGTLTLFEEPISRPLVEAVIPDTGCETLLLTCSSDERSPLIQALTIPAAPVVGTRVPVFKLTVAPLLIDAIQVGELSVGRMPMPADVLRPCLRFWLGKRWFDLAPPSRWIRQDEIEPLYVDLMRWVYRSPLSVAHVLAGDWSGKKIGRMTAGKRSSGKKRKEPAREEPDPAGEESRDQIRVAYARTLASQNRLVSEPPLGYFIICWKTALNSIAMRDERLLDMAFSLRDFFGLMRRLLRGCRRMEFLEDLLVAEIRRLWGDKAV